MTTPRSDATATTAGRAAGTATNTTVSTAVSTVTGTVTNSTVTGTVAGTGTGPAASTATGTALLTTAATIPAFTPPSFDRASVLAPGLVAEFLGALDRRAPSLKAAVAEARAGRYSAASLEAFVGLCLGCKIFGVLMRFGLIPEDVCEECNNVGARIRHLQEATAK